VNHGACPLDDLYLDFTPMASNLREVDHDVLIARNAQAVAPSPVGRFRLVCIGDAVAARNAHAATHDALRLGKDL
jgi:N-methyl-L-proline demethylase